MGDFQFKVKKEQFGFSGRPRRKSMVMANLSFESSRTGWVDDEPTETLDAERAYIRWLAVMATISDDRVE